MRLFLALNGSDVRVTSPETGDEFVRAVAQSQVDPAETTRTLHSWGPSD